MQDNITSNHSNETNNNSVLRLILTGFTMGIADLVPGVSGGTIALLLGVYDELIESIKIVTSDVIKLLFKGKFTQAIKTIPFKFLIPVFGGIFAAIFGFVQIVEYLLNTYPVYTWALFFGLIIGTVHVISNRIREWTAQRILLAAIAAFASFLVVGLPPAEAQATTIGFAVTGLIAICAMILPGISGSLIMLIMGQYENVISAISELKLQLLMSFAVGAAAGLALFSRLLSWLLDNYHKATLAFLTGLMIGALRAVWPWRTELPGGQFEVFLPQVKISLLVALLCGVVGYLVVIQLERAGIAREHDEDLS